MGETNYDKDRVEYRYNTMYQKLKYGSEHFLKKNRKYNQLKRKLLQISNKYINKEVELTQVDPNKIKMMQEESNLTKERFRFNFDRVPLHSTDKARFNPSQRSGLIKGGEWDKFTKPYKFDRVYRGIKKHFKNNVDWEETEYYQQYKLREKTYQKDGYAEEQIRKTEKLYKEIKENGFLTRYDRNILDKYQPPYLKNGQWPITVNIGRDGELIFNNTAHNRLAISKILDLDKIPVLIVCRHKKWADIKGIKYS